MDDATAEATNAHPCAHIPPLTMFPGWPDKPKRLYVIDGAEIWSLVGDISMLLLSVAFAGMLTSLAFFVALHYVAIRDRAYVSPHIY
jgi:hypothetical protein